MSMLDGVNQCWPLAKDCVAWWDAWAAVFAFAGVLVAALAAIAVFWLGWQTHKATLGTALLAKQIKDRDDDRAARESLVLAAYLFPEVVQCSVHFRKFHDELSAEGMFDEIVEEEGNRARILDLMTNPAPSRCIESITRLATLPVEHCAALTQAIGYVNTGVEMAKGFQEPGTEAADATRFASIVRCSDRAAVSFMRARDLLKNLLHLEA